jgi:transcriptional regulator with XRE-family HTH domain
MTDFGSELRRFMELRGLGVRELARRVPCNPGYVSNLRSGAKRPSPGMAQVLDQILGGGGTLARLAAGGGPGSSGRSVLDELTDQAVDIGQWAEMTNVGTGTVEQLDEAIHAIARDYLVFPPEPLIARAAEVSRRVFGLLREHQRLRHTRDLYVIGAKSCAFLSWAAGDLGQFSAAAAQGRAALILAGEAEHPGVRALALCALSKAAFWEARRESARDLARAGYECAPANSTRVLLACQEADATGPADAREAMGRAVQAHGEVACADDLGGVFGCGEVRLANYLMGVYLRAGKIDAVLEVAAGAAAEAEAGEPIGYGTRGQIQIGAGIAHVRSGDVEGAAEMFGPVLGMPPDLRLATLTSRLGPVAGTLLGPAYRQARTASALAEQISAYCAGADTTRVPALPHGEDKGR